MDAIGEPCFADFPSAIVQACPSPAQPTPYPSPVLVFICHIWPALSLLVLPASTILINLINLIYPDHLTIFNHRQPSSTAFNCLQLGHSVLTDTAVHRLSSSRDSCYLYDLEPLDSTTYPQSAGLAWSLCLAPTASFSKECPTAMLASYLLPSCSVCRRPCTPLTFPTSPATLSASLRTICGLLIRPPFLLSIRHASPPAVPMTCIPTLPIIPLTT